MRTRLPILVVTGAFAAALIVPAVASAHGTHLKTTMTGEQVVGAAGAAGGDGKARIHLLKGKERLCFKVSWSGTGSNKGLFIGLYKGAAGENGALKVTLVEGDQRTKSPVEGCVLDLPFKRLKRINEHPKLYHVNVKNSKYPNDGAIRGQLRAKKK
jgi:hypothetical protein